MTLVDFLQARLDEEEKAARAAKSHTGRWRWDHGTGAMCDDPTCEYGELVDEAEPGATVEGTVLMEVHGYDIREPWQGADHVARHDPARALAEVEAKRRIIEEHKPAKPHYLRSRERGCLSCTTAQTWDAEANEAICLTLRLLALPYADHPDYREEWRP